MLNKIGKLDVQGKQKDLEIEWDRPLYDPKQKEKILAIFQSTVDKILEHVKANRKGTGLDVRKIEKIDQSGIYLTGNQRVMTPDLEAAWADFWGDLMDYAEEIAPGLRDGNRDDVPYSSDVLDASFKWTDDKRPELDPVGKGLKFTEDTSTWTNEEIIEAAGRYARQMLPDDDENNKKFQETKLGIALSMIPRKRVYQADVRLSNGRELVAREVWAFNSRYAKDGTAASLDRSVTPVNLRQGEDGVDGSSNYYTGRVHSLDAAKEQAEFLFRSEMSKSRDALKGITWDPTNGEFVFTYAVQSLLATGWDGMNSYKKAEAAYQKLKAIPASDRITYDNVKMPDGTFRNGVKVRFVPIGPASTSINQFWAKRSHRLKVNKAFSQDCRALLPTLHPSKRAEAEQAIARLESFQDDPLNTNWEEILLRAYVCHLLNIPEIVHCQSSKDRTGFIVASIAAMKQYLKYYHPAGQPVDILAIVKTKEFKELFKMNLILGVKMTQVGNVNKGYKFDGGAHLSRRIYGIQPIEQALPDSSDREAFLTERALIYHRKRKEPDLITSLKKVGKRVQVSLQVPQTVGGSRIQSLQSSPYVLPDVPFVQYVLRGKRMAFERLLSFGEHLILSLDSREADYDTRLSTILQNLQIAKQALMETHYRKWHAEQPRYSDAQRDRAIEKIESRFSKFKSEILPDIR